MRRTDLDNLTHKARELIAKAGGAARTANFLSFGTERTNNDLPNPNDASVSNGWGFSFHQTEPQLAFEIL